MDAFYSYLHCYCVDVFTKQFQQHAVGHSNHYVDNVQSQSYYLKNQHLTVIY